MTFKDRFNVVALLVLLAIATGAGFSFTFMVQNLNWCNLISFVLCAALYCFACMFINIVRKK